MKQHTINSSDFPHYIGLDHMFNNLARRTGVQADAVSYPPYNVITTSDNEYIVELAVAGFGKDELSVVVDKGDLVIEGSKEESDDETKYLHKGISSRKFQRSFKLAEHVQVVGADVKDGIMSIKLEREVPEELQPKKIAIDFKG